MIPDGWYVSISAPQPGEHGIFGLSRCAGSGGWLSIVNADQWNGKCNKNDVCPTGLAGRGNYNSRNLMKALSGDTRDRWLTWAIIVVSLSGILYFGYRAVKEDASPDRENPFEYSVENLGTYDLALEHYTETVAISIGFSDPHGIAVGNDVIYVTGGGTITVMSEDGTVVDTIPTGDTAWCVAVDDSGFVYCGMAGHIDVYGRDGVKKMQWAASNDNAVFTSIAVAGEFVFAADAGNRIVRKYDSRGNELSLIGGRDESADIPGFIVPSPYFDVCIDPDGFLWVTNPGRHTLENYTFEGDMRTSWGEFSIGIEGFCGCCNPTHIAILADGTFVTSEKGIARVKVYDRLGNLSSVVAGPDAFDEGVAGLDLAVDSNGRIFVLDPARKAVRIFERKHPEV